MLKRSGVVTPMKVLKKITSEDMPSKKMKKVAEDEQQTKTAKEK